MPTKLLERPSPRQQEFLRATERFVAYGGARGGGKSWALRFKAQVLAVRYPGIRMLMLRRTLPELLENHIRPLQEALWQVAEYKEGKRAFEFPNGSLLRFGYCDSESDVNRYQGQEYDVIFIDEATQLSERQFLALLACNRGANRFPKRVYLTCNPGGVGHAWVKRLFVDGDYRPDERPQDYRFVPARVYDNAPLLRQNPEYLQSLKLLPDALRRAWLDGDWDVFAGQYFGEFRREVHVMQPFAIPQHWRRYAAFDYGLDMLACYWAAFDEQGHGYVYRELYEKDLIVSQAAQKILALTGEEQVYAFFAPSDLWGRSAESGMSRAERFAQAGLYLTRVVAKSRVDGWLTVKEWLRCDEKGARLRIFSSCRNLIRCLPLLQHDPHNPSDCATDPHELTHAPDALRYLLGGRPGQAEAPQGIDPFAPPQSDDEALAGYGVWC